MQKMVEDLLAHLGGISESFQVPAGQKVVAHIAGGMAVNYYAGSRMSDDADIEWSHRVILPPEQQHFLTEDPNGYPVMVTIDAGFSNLIGLFHPDWKEDAMPIMEFPNLLVKIISPLDLIVSKIGQFVEHDRDDIRDIATAVPINREALKQRALEALNFYVGNLDHVGHSVHLALDIVDEANSRVSGRT